MTTAGDTVYATAANALARLAVGTARQFLLVNAGATAPAWSSIDHQANVLGANTDLGNGSWTDLCSLSLAAGKWRLTGTLFALNSNVTVQSIGSRLLNDATPVTDGELSVGGSEYGHITILGIITLGATTTVKLQGIANATNTQARIAGGVASTNTTQLVAERMG